jgi:hypothetical protein
MPCSEETTLGSLGKQAQSMAQSLWLCSTQNGPDLSVWAQAKNKEQTVSLNMKNMKKTLVAHTCNSSYLRG